MRSSHHLTFIRLSSLLIAAIAAGCAPTLETPNDTPEIIGEEPCQTADPVCSAELGNGVAITHVAAVDQLAWVYFDFDTMDAVEVADPESSDSWDLAFRRFTIKVNGGVSGTGGVEFTRIENLPFTAVTLAPTTEYLVDMPDDEDEDEDPEYLMSTGDTAWFSYNPATHVLTPHDVVYAIRSVEGEYYKMQVLQYYDQVGSPAHIRFQWATIASP